MLRAKFASRLLITVSGDFAICPTKKKGKKTKETVAVAGETVAVAGKTPKEKPKKGKKQRKFSGAPRNSLIINELRFKK
jgi:hypothetical protein